MLHSLGDVIASLRAIHQLQDLPKAFRLLAAVPELRAGGDARSIAKSIGTTATRLAALLAAPDPIENVFKASLEQASEPRPLGKARQGLGQMLLGTLAERVFEDIYKRTMGTNELQLEDSRSSRTDTDYLVLNGQRRKVFRMNIKFHGSPFRKARDLVGLEPEDCFALATYKIDQANRKQLAEVLPFIFVIVGVPGLRGETVGEQLPAELVHLASLVGIGKISGKQAFEDAVVHHLIDNPQSAGVEATIAGFRKQIEAAAWRVLSAARARKLLHELLFERVFAVRVKGFTRNYPRAEVDMHFSVSSDLTPLETFLGILRDHGLPSLSIRLDRGDV
jgi:hypothetical protein